jgi:hypothetical protein
MPATRVLMSWQRFRIFSSISASPVGSVISSRVGHIRHVQDGVDEKGSGARRYMPGLHPQVGVDQVGVGLDVGLGEEMAVVFDGDVLKVRHIDHRGGVRSGLAGDDGRVSKNPTV